MTPKKQDILKQTYALKFVGLEGHFLSGVPARDLSAAEFEALPDETRALVLACGLYEVIQDKDGD